jgi:hypothetical protein
MLKINKRVELIEIHQNNHSNSGVMTVMKNNNNKIKIYKLIYRIEMIMKMELHYTIRNLIFKKNKIVAS